MPDIPTEALEAEEAASAAAAEEVWNLAYAAGLAAGEKRGRAQAAADIRTEAAQLEERDGVGYSYAYGFADAAEFIAPAAAVAEEGDDPTCDDANHLYPADGVRGTPCLCGKTHLQPLGERSDTP